MAELLGLGQALLDAADEQATTCSHPATPTCGAPQPTALGHWFNAHCWSGSRNLARMVQLHDRLDECPLGGAAHSGTEWPSTGPPPQPTSASPGRSATPATPDSPPSMPGPSWPPSWA